MVCCRLSCCSNVHPAPVRVEHVYTGEREGQKERERKHWTKKVEISAPKMGTQHTNYAFHKSPNAFHTVPFVANPLCLTFFSGNFSAGSLKNVVATATKKNRDIFCDSLSIFFYPTFVLLLKGSSSVDVFAFTFQTFLVAQRFFQLRRELFIQKALNFWNSIKRLTLNFSTLQKTVSGDSKQKKKP